MFARILIAALCLHLTPTWAGEEKHWYTGLSLGRSDIQNGCSLVGNWNTCSDSDTAPVFMLGWRPTKQLGLEASYVNFGTVSAIGSELVPSSNDPTKMVLTQRNATWEGKALSLSALGYLPLSDAFDLHARLGASWWRVDYDSVIPGYVTSYHRKGVSPLVGLGATYKPAPGLNLRAEWQRHHDVDNLNIDLWLLSVLFTF